MFWFRFRGALAYSDEIEEMDTVIRVLLVRVVKSKICEYIELI